MIARDTGGGTSFVGAGRYYLHDMNADTDERVAFTHTDNLLTDDAEKAMKVMAWTAAHQADLKAAAGVKATGRKLAKPVHTFVFAWAKEEDPSHEHMLETARSAIERLGLAAHEAVYVGHDDKDHAHVHVIVNRVHPETGKAATLSKSRLTLSQWAEAYEREHGIHCHQRIENNERRARGDRVIDLESRRRNAEHFSDWREKRAREAAPAKEQRRFQEWAERKRTQLAQDKERGRKRLEDRLAAKKSLIEARFARSFDVSGQKARLQELDAALSVGGIKGVWRRLSGRRARDMASRDEVEKNIGAIQHRHDQALRKLRAKIETERGAFLAEQRTRAQELAQRIENARARREREGWKSYKTDKPRTFERKPANDTGARAERLLRNWDHNPARSRDRGPGWER